MPSLINPSAEAAVKKLIECPTVTVIVAASAEGISSFCILISHMRTVNLRGFSCAVRRGDKFFFTDPIFGRTVLRSLMTSRQKSAEEALLNFKNSTPLDGMRSVLQYSRSGYAEASNCNQ